MICCFLSQVKSQKAAKNRGGGGFPNIFSGPDIIPKLKADPRTASYLNDPDYLALLAQLQANPQSLGAKLQDPRILTTLTVLMGIDPGMYYEILFLYIFKLPVLKCIF